MILSSIIGVCARSKAFQNIVECNESIAFADDAPAHRREKAAPRHSNTWHGKSAHAER